MRCFGSRWKDPWIASSRIAVNYLLSIRHTIHGRHDCRIPDVCRIPDR